ncbi:GntR family transcriptional regulator [Enterococcus sp. PF1-24]|uniref:GntR family transcriptional regulator n=1 Tax=unclassified Enterococcus TaxID=2608891 RepID=UPI002473456F|nr:MULTISPECIES: GntR family transcriptional regulator [unclassified Enterococcus]MDH6365750.1 GntR family transcriptional regulator [Enterococcus sp. PFB1-1]MDH6402850.1 GntR family transcriptional regulator [Enterococcus sp. PF1-24]
MVSINKNSSKPYYEQLMLSIKEDILQGILQPGDRLPSVRELASQLMMNPNTISKTYKLLEGEQVLITVKGKGTYVKALTDVQRDEYKVGKLKARFNDLVIEAGHLLVTKAEIIDWITESEINLGGLENENSSIE